MHMFKLIYMNWGGEIEPQRIQLNDINGITRFLTAFGDPTRIRILNLLGNKGRLNVGEIAGEFEISRPAISHHLKILRDAQIVGNKKRGQEVYYWLAREKVVTDFRTLADLVDSFDCGD